MKLSDDVREVLEELVYFADESEGVAGWHLNGEIEPWENFEFVEKAREILNTEKRFSDGKQEPNCFEE